MLQDLENNIKTIVAAYEAQKSRADKLERELTVCRKSQEAAQNKVKELEDKVDNLNMRSLLVPSEGENVEAKAEIDKLIQEVDKVLALLQ